MVQLEWIKDLVEAEDKSIEMGVIEVNSQYQQQRALVQSSLDLLLKLKEKFTDAISLYNDLKFSPLSKIKLYSIAQTHADFMIFRNGYKMIFSLKEAGILSVRFNFIGSQILSTAQIAESKINSKIFDEQLLIAKTKAFNQIYWTYQDQEFDIDHLIKFYFSLFARESLN
ncbi:MAG: hypothetical protein L6Q37_15215 [Bdellovibrionaceae bacterium]|nr:hypothetical protein [Pseudobdellovibrionaceae bacterium]NUM59544.1 hypothetical protein [Pseudobdellovibrionaceae bacterium]